MIIRFTLRLASTTLTRVVWVSRCFHFSATIPTPLSTPIELHLLDVITPEQMEGRTATDIGEQIYQMMSADLGADYAPTETENP